MAPKLKIRLRAVHDVNITRVRYQQSNLGEINKRSYRSLIILLSFWKAGSVAPGLFQSRVRPYFFAGNTIGIIRFSSAKKIGLPPGFA